MWCLRSAIRGLPRAPSLIGSGRSCDSLRVVLVPSSRLASSENNNSNIIPAAPLKNDPDSFGNLAPKNSVFRRQEVDPAEEEDDRGEAEYEAKLADTFRPRPIDYNRKMGRAIEKDKDLKEALRLLDEMKTELVKPNDGHFRALIHACGKVGYTKKVCCLTFIPLHFFHVKYLV